MVEPISFVGPHKYQKVLDPEITKTYRIQNYKVLLRSVLNMPYFLK